MIWLMGYKPGWVTNVGHRSGNTEKNARANTTQAMMKACIVSSVSDPFLWTYDDVFLMKPIDYWPLITRGPLDDVINERDRANDSYLFGMKATRDLLTLHGYKDLLSFELHSPLVVYKADMLKTLDFCERSGRSNIHKRTVYGNMLGLKGHTVLDHKITMNHKTWDREALFISTNDETFKRHAVGTWIREHFPDKCAYEL